MWRIFRQPMKGRKRVAGSSEVSREHVVDASRLTIELEGIFSSNMWTVTNPHHIRR